MATFPTYPAISFEQAVDLAIFSSNQIGGVVNGDATAEVETENGNIPSLRKALVDNFFFKDPEDWAAGSDETVFNQLRFFSNGVLSAFYYAPTATTSNPVEMGTTPVGDSNWVLYSMQQTQTPAEVFPWTFTAATGSETVIAPPYIFDSAIVTINGIVQVPDSAYTIENSTIVLKEPLGIDPSTGSANILFAYLGKVKQGVADYVQSDVLASSAGYSLIGEVNSAADLRTLIPTKASQRAELKGYVGGTSVGGGKFYYTEDTTTADDRGTFFRVNSAGGWRRSEQAMTGISITPFHFGGVGDGKADDTVAMKAAIAYAGSTSTPLDISNGPWRVSQTLDFTNVRTIFAGYSGRILVNPANFTAAHTNPYAVVFGNPDVGASAGRCAYINVIGQFSIISDGRNAKLSGLYIKGQLLTFDAIRVASFDGAGLNMSAVWDSAFTSISCELCGNVDQYQIGIYAGGDTSNCLSIGRIQSEQAWQKCLSINCIRSFINNIHAERTYIISTDDGTTGLPSGLKYTTMNINIGNTEINQLVHDCIASNDPNGNPVAAKNCSVVLNLDYSTLKAAALSGSYVSTTYGNYSSYEVIRCSSWYCTSNQAKYNTVKNARVDVTLNMAYNWSFIGSQIALLVPQYNANNLSFTDCEFTSLSFANNIQGDIVFDHCRFVAEMSIGQTKSPSNTVGAIQPYGETLPPVTFNDCVVLGTVTGAYNARAIFNRGYIATVALVSQAIFEFYDVKIGTFGYSGNSAFITRNCKAATVNNWTYPHQIYWSPGTITERMGYTAGSQAYISTAIDSITWVALY